MSFLESPVPCCQHTGDLKPSQELLLTLACLNAHLNFKLKYTSGIRCPMCNESAGGEPNSAHLTGLAVDISTIHPSERYHILKTAFSMGITRIGIYEKHIHIDIDKDKPQLIAWFK